MIKCRLKFAARVFLNRKPQRSNAASGFTLIEAVMGMVLLSAISISAILFVKPILEIAVQKQFTNGIAYEGHLAIMKMTRDISQLRDNQSVDAASVSLFQFDNVNNENIVFTTSSGLLTRNGVKMAEGVTALQFTYFDADNAEIETPELIPTTDIDHLEILLSVTLGGNARTWRVQVKPRNLAV